jgi:hypothetical protein
LLGLTKFLRALLDVMEPTTAKNWLAAIRALAQHCIKRDLLDNDPTLGIKLRRMTGDGFATWTARCPPKNRHRRCDLHIPARTAD